MWGRSAAEILAHVLPEVFDRFKEAAAKSSDVNKGVDALFVAENLQGLPPVFSGLGLVRAEKSKTVFCVYSGPLKVVLDRIEERANYGDTACGRFLADEFAREPFGWELEQVLTEPRLHDLARARQVLTIAWPFLDTEEDLSADFRSRANELTDLLGRETFFKDFPAIEQHAEALENEYARRFEGAMQAQLDAYTKAHTQLTRTPGWAKLPEEVQRVIASLLQAGVARLPASVPIPLLRSERDACEGRFRSAIRAEYEALEGERLASVHVNSYFAGGIETEEQLDSALAGLGEECVRLMGAGKKVVLS